MRSSRDQLGGGELEIPEDIEPLGRDLEPAPADEVASAAPDRHDVQASSGRCWTQKRRRGLDRVRVERAAQAAVRGHEDQLDRLDLALDEQRMQLGIRARGERRAGP